eukprot:scaffold952_cov249-Pinguiococcus_pyrenoidosus.AAC.34
MRPEEVHDQATELFWVHESAEFEHLRSGARINDRDVGELLRVPKAVALGVKFALARGGGALPEEEAGSDQLDDGLVAPGVAIQLVTLEDFRILNVDQKPFPLLPGSLPCGQEGCGEAQVPRRWEHPVGVVFRLRAEEGNVPSLAAHAHRRREGTQVILHQALLILGDGGPDAMLVHRHVCCRRTSRLGTEGCVHRSCSPRCSSLLAACSGGSRSTDRRLHARVLAIFVLIHGLVERLRRVKGVGLNPCCPVAQGRERGGPRGREGRIHSRSRFAPARLHEDIHRGFHLWRIRERQPLH